MKYVNDAGLPEITEQQIRETLKESRPYTVVILKAGPQFKPPGPNRDPEVTAIVMQHGKRNMALRAAGLMPIVCRIADGSGVVGVGIFDASPEEVQRIYADDPVKAGAFTFSVHPCLSFPGSALPMPEAAVQDSSRPGGT